MGMRWYTVQAKSNMEKSIIRSLNERIDRLGVRDKFGQILMATEEVSELKDGKKKVTQRKIYPGYIFIEMEMDDESWHLVKHIPGVSGFVGGSGTKPAAIPERDIQHILQQVQQGAEKPRPKMSFEVGEIIRIKEGPFNDFNGNIEQVNYDKNRLKVTVTIFGRSTPVDLDFQQVEKV